MSVYIVMNYALLLCPQLPKFFNLCEDGIWGVRKACTECFMDVSSSLSPSARHNDLAQLFVGLLCDQSRWVSEWPELIITGIDGWTDLLSNSHLYL